MVDATQDREIVITRVIDAPPDLVFAAFTQLEHAENWWVPTGTITHEYNVRPGGHWRYSQPGPHGTQMSFKITFMEVSRPTQLVYHFGMEAEGAPDPVRTRLTFEDQDGKTRVTLQLVFATAADHDEAMKHGAAVGATRALDNVARYLATT